MNQLKRIPWIVWALLAPALIMGVWKLVSGTGKVIPIVGAGPLSELRAEHAPEGLRYDLKTRPTESIEQTRRRIERAITSWPDVLVFGLDPLAAGADPEAARATLDALATEVENATGAAVIVLDDSTASLARSTCIRGRWRVCVDLSSHMDDPDAIRAAIAAGIRDGIAEHDALRATTQTGR